MMAEERLSRIVEMTNARGYVSTKDLAAQLQVSEPTIRADCRELEKLGRIIRVHGGAKSRQTRDILTRSLEKAMDDRQNVDEREKDRLCRYAASLVQEDDCIFIDGGTTFATILPYLKGKRVRIVTHSQIVVDSFGEDNGELFVIGGSYSPQYKMNLGPIALSQLESFNFQYAFLSCAGVDLTRRKAYTAELETAEVKKKAMQLAEKSFLFVNGAKQRVKGFCSFADLDDFDGIVTDSADQDVPENFIVLEES
ncbi:DeoR/GlpR family DNA-binding transcription regulator [uncultured Faecalibaculum sp.]|uniref:DeoR/GlpR family DNA-binding transcription regulator n=1 Tax=uncultured Faecalibaculum sp. TaxID=1729681 RepID=UPI00272C02A4|nr:DeoR/GlpR family DNA-binding transcription regulator [uncultured Faecalibaculum sp.]